MSEAHYYDPSAWRLVPGRTVHVVVDDQNDFLHPDGWYATHEMDVSHMRRVIEPNRRLLAGWRANALPVMHTREGHRPDLSDLPPAKKIRSATSCRCIPGRRKPRRICWRPHSSANPPSANGLRANSGRPSKRWPICKCS